MKNNYCSQCGAALRPAAKFCAQCGTALGQIVETPANAAAAKQAPTPGQPADGQTLEWQAEMSLLTNRFFLGDCLKWLVLSLLLCALIFLPLLGFTGGGEGVVAAFIFLAFVPALMIPGILIFAAIMGNRVPMEFSIDEQGVRMRSVSNRIKGINRTAMILGLLAGKPGMIGAGATGMSQEKEFIVWGDLRKVKFYPVQRVVFLKGGILSRIRLYCTAENYEAVERLIRKNAPPTVIQ